MNIEGDAQILEMEVCDTLEVCKPKSQGGVLSKGRERTPQISDKGCEPGKFMYFG
jgi:hypothetical protein